MNDRITYIVPSLSSALVIGPGPLVLRMSLSEHFRVVGGHGRHGEAVRAGAIKPVDRVAYDPAVPAVEERIEDEGRTVLVVGTRFVVTLVRSMEPLRLDQLLRRVFDNPEDVDAVRADLSNIYHFQGLTPLRF